MSDLQPSFSLHILPESGDGTVVPANILIEVISNAQKSFELIGCNLGGHEFRRRARLPASIAQKYRLLCHVPQRGSYAIPFSVGQLVEGESYESPREALSVFSAALTGIAGQNLENLKQLVPDNRLYRRLLVSLKGILPRPGSPWVLQYRDNQDTLVATLEAAATQFLQDALSEIEGREELSVVTGELVAIDFGERKITISYPPTQRFLECIYDEAVEEMLYARRRDLLQVTGRVSLDEQGNPMKILDVSSIRDVDLSSYVASVFVHGKRKMRSKFPIVLEPALDDSRQLICLNFERLGIHVFAYNREQLTKELDEQIFMLWDEYATVPTEELDSVAQELKQNLLDTFQEI